MVSTRGVPDLQLYFFSINLYLPELKIDSNRRKQALVELVIDKSIEDGRLADGGVPYQHHLELIDGFRYHYYKLF